MTTATAAARRRRPFARWRKGVLFSGRAPGVGRVVRPGSGLTLTARGAVRRLRGRGGSRLGLDSEPGRTRRGWAPGWLDRAGCPHLPPGPRLRAAAAHPRRAGLQPGRAGRPPADRHARDRDRPAGRGPAQLVRPRRARERRLRGRRGGHRAGAVAAGRPARPAPGAALGAAAVGRRAPAGWWRWPAPGPVPVLLGCAAVMSAASSQLGSCVRARWSAALVDRPAEVPRAYAWEAVVDEVVFVVGPLVVVLCALLDPAVGLLAAFVLGGAGTLAFLALRDTEPAVQPAPGAGGRSALASAGLRTLTLSMLCVGLVFGTVEVSMVAFAQERGSRPAAGCCWRWWPAAAPRPGCSTGRCTGGPRPVGATCSARLPRRRPRAAAARAERRRGWRRRRCWPASRSARCSSSRSGSSRSSSRPSARTEGFSWLNSGLGVGVAAGFAVSGAVADGAGARTAFLVAFGGALAAGAVALVARGRSPPRAGGGEPRPRRGRAGSRRAAARGR